MRFFSFLLRRPLLTLATLTLAGCLGVVIGTLAALERSLPPVEGLKDYRSHVVTRILDRNGKDLAELFREKRIWIARRQLPKDMVEALLAEGDETFLSGNGVRYAALLGALFVDLRKGTMIQGGDTITGQVARRMIPTDERTATQKIRETLLAMRIEGAYSKDEILEIYCNTVPLGHGARGFEAAARIYFDKSVGELTLAENALLAGMTRSPERYSLVNEPKLALQRRDTILSRMVERGIITAAQEQSARREQLRLKKTDRANEGEFALVIRLTEEYLLKTYGADQVFRQGLIVTTTIDKDLQRSAEAALRQGLTQLEERIDRKRIYSDKVTPQGLLLSLRPGDGEIVALGAVGEAGSDMATLLRPRRTGGAILPFIYLAALESGYTLADRVDDVPTTFIVPGEPGGWRPTSRNGRYLGSVTLREALTDRLAVASVRLLEKVGVDHAVGALHRFGVTAALPRDLYLAAGETPLSPMELVGAYAGFANGGFIIRPAFIRSVATANGELLEEREPAPVEGGREATYLLTTALKGAATDGAAKGAATLERPVAAMTGESEEIKDAWFIGYTPTLTTGVWVGIDRDRPLGRGESGNDTAGPIWNDFMIRALDRTAVADFVPPTGVVVKKIDPASGKLASDACDGSMAEFFIQGTEPVERCRRASDLVNDTRTTP